MPVSLDLGTIDIADQQTAHFVQGQSMDDLKKMVADFLTQQAHRLQRKPVKSQGKWEAFADRMSGLGAPEITKHIQETRQEMRGEFAFREIDQRT